MKRYIKSPQRIAKKRLGASAVELALVLPLLLALVFTMIEASRFLMAVHATTGAAREAGRVFAATRDTASAKEIAREFLANSSFDVEDVTFRNSRIEF